MPQQAANQVIYTSVTLRSTSCWCGVAFAVEENFLAGVRAKKGKIFCPLGHEGWHNHRNEADQLRDQLAEKERALQFERTAKENARAEAERVSRSNIALRGVVKRSKNRAIAAMCPVGGCRRHFVALDRHMKAKHPGYAKQEID